jgi:hypothetical protein
MLSAIDRNHCPPSNGMPVRHHRNTHVEQITDAGGLDSDTAAAPHRRTHAMDLGSRALTALRRDAPSRAAAPPKKSSRQRGVAKRPLTVQLSVLIG